MDKRELLKAERNLLLSQISYFVLTQESDKHTHYVIKELIEYLEELLTTDF